MCDFLGPNQLDTNFVIHSSIQMYLKRHKIVRQCLQKNDVTDVSQRYFQIHSVFLNLLDVTK